jgi:Protein of unknown function (DUF2795)
MINVSSHPKLADLHQLIAAVPHYPLTAADLVTYARQHNYPQEVIDFYESFAPDQPFYSRDDALGRTELIELIQTENQPAEDFVHGAED